MVRGRGGRTLVVLGVVVATLLTACTGQNGKQPGAPRSAASSSSAPNSATALAAASSGDTGPPVAIRLTSAGATLSMPGGAMVVVPSGSVAGAGQLSGQAVVAPAPAPAGLVLAGPVYRLAVTGTTLTGPVSVTLPVPAPAAGPAGPRVYLVAYYDTTTSMWTPVPAQANPAGTALTATSSHLSLWSLLTADTAKILDGASKLVQTLIGTSSAVAQPVCTGSGALAAAKVAVVSDAGGLMKWCAGQDASGRTVLTVANNRHYAVETDYPATWTMTRVGAGDPVTDQVLTSVAHLISPARAGEADVIIPGGHVVTFTLPAGASGEAVTNPSVQAYLVSAFLYGVSTFEMTMADVPGAPHVDLGKSAKAVAAALTATDCVRSIDGLLHSDVSSVTAVGSLFRTTADLALSCLGSSWKAAYGIGGFVGSFVLGVLLWLADGVSLVLQGVHEAIDTGIYWRGYRIAVSAPAASASASGAANCPSVAALTAIAHGEDPSHSAYGVSPYNRPYCVDGWILAGYYAANEVSSYVSFTDASGAWHVASAGVPDHVCLSVPVAAVVAWVCMGLDGSVRRPPDAAIAGMWTVMRAHGRIPPNGNVGWTVGSVAVGSCFVPSLPTVKQFPERFLWDQDPSCSPQGSGGYPASRISKAADSVPALGSCVFVMVSSDGRRFGCLT